MRKQFDIRTCDSDATGALSLSDLLIHMQEVAGDDSHNLGFGKDKVFDQGLRWVISRTSAKVLRMPKYGERVEIITVAEPNKMFFYPRFTALRTVDGELLLESESIWAIIDYKTRKPVLPKASGIVIGASESIEKELSFDTKIPAIETTEEADRKVLFSDIDINGHMNNTKYVEWAYDLLGSEYLKNKQLSDFKLSYHTEAKEGETITQKFSKTEKEFYVIGSVGERKVYEVYLKFE
ncbi:MAG: thioesterase [Bacilli bacterium]|nr:thioesterase [Bacilli bacterium]